MCGGGGSEPVDKPVAGRRLTQTPGKEHCVWEGTGAVFPRVVWNKNRRMQGEAWNRLSPLLRSQHGQVSAPRNLGSKGLW